MLNQNLEPLMCVVQTYLLPTQGRHLAAPSSCGKTPFPSLQCLKFFSKCECTETEQTVVLHITPFILEVRLAVKAFSIIFIAKR